MNLTMFLGAVAVFAVCGGTVASASDDDAGDQTPRQGGLAPSHLTTILDTGAVEFLRRGRYANDGRRIVFLDEFNHLRGKTSLPLSDDTSFLEKLYDQYQFYLKLNTAIDRIGAVTDANGEEAGEIIKRLTKIDSPYFLADITQEVEKYRYKFLLPFGIKKYFAVWAINLIKQSRNGDYYGLEKIAASTYEFILACVDKGVDLDAAAALDCFAHVGRMSTETYFAFVDRCLDKIAETPGLTFPEAVRSLSENRPDETRSRPVSPATTGAVTAAMPRGR